MSAETLRKLWLALSIAAVVLSLSVLGNIQGADFDVKVNAFASLLFAPGTPDAIVALWGAALLAILFFVSGPIMAAHARLGGPTAADRFPFRLWDAPADDPIAIKGQAVAFVLATLLPLWTLFHAWKTLVGEGRLCVEMVKGVWTEAGFGLFALPPDWTVATVLGDTYRLAGEEGCGKEMTTFFPFFEPLVLLALTLWALWRLTRALLLVTAAPPATPGPSGV